MKQLSDDIKIEIRSLASDMIAITARACDECEVTSKAEADLMTAMVGVELQTELVRHLQMEETGK